MLLAAVASSVPKTLLVYIIVYLGRKRIMISPSPVAAAPPTSLSTYAPAPAIGESPTRLILMKNKTEVHYEAGTLTNYLTDYYTKL